MTGADQHKLDSKIEEYQARLSIGVVSKVIWASEVFGNRTHYTGTNSILMKFCIGGSLRR